MQMKIVNRPLQMILNELRMLAPETRVWDFVGGVQTVEKAEAEARREIRGVGRAFQLSG
jgi:hypothetical protein